MRPSCPVPKIIHHKGTDQDVVVVREEGRRRFVYLGKHDSPEAKQRYREVLADHLAGKPVASVRDAKQRPKPSDWPTVGQMVAEFLLHAARYYVGPDGKPTREVENLQASMRMLLELHRDTPTDRFTIKHLLDVRQGLVDLREHHKKGRNAPDGLSRRVVNARVQRMKAAFRWGTEQKLVPGSTWHELSALRGLKKGRAGVRDHAPVEAVAWKLVEETLPHLVPTIRDAVLVQWWCGARPSELLAMTRRQLDMTGKTWLYTCAHHKGDWREKPRVITLGPKAQAILRPRLSLGLDTPLFSGRDAWNERRAAKRAARKSAPTEQTRERDLRGDAHADTIAEQMTVHEYRRHLHRAADKAEVPRWSPHRLRHAAGTRLTKEVGIEGARAALGHADDRTTRRYAHGADVAIAADVASRLG